MLIPVTNVCMNLGMRLLRGTLGRRAITFPVDVERSESRRRGSILDGNVSRVYTLFISLYAFQNARTRVIRRLAHCLRMLNQ